MKNRKYTQAPVYFLQAHVQSQFSTGVPVMCNQ